MNITDKKIDELAHLARLEFTGEKKEKIKQDLEQILGFVDKLKELETSEVEPLVYMSDAVNKLREDQEQKTITKQEGLKNAPKKDSDYFRVPKVISK